MSSQNSIIDYGGYGVLYGTPEGYFAAFDRVRMQGDFKIHAPLNILNRLTVDGTMDASGNTALGEALLFGSLSFTRDATLDGMATLTNVRLPITNKEIGHEGTSTTVTLGPNVTIRGRVSIAIEGDGTALVNQGRIIADVPHEGFPETRNDADIALLQSINASTVERMSLINEGLIEVRNQDRLTISAPQGGLVLNRGTLRATDRAFLWVTAPLVSPKTICDAGAVCELKGTLTTDSGQVSELSGAGQWLANSVEFRGGTVRLTGGAVLEGAPVFNDVTFQGELHNYDNNSRKSSLPPYVSGYVGEIVVKTNLTLNGLIAFHRSPADTGGRLLFVSARDQLSGQGQITIEPCSYPTLIGTGSNLPGDLTLGPGIQIEGSGFTIGTDFRAFGNPFPPFVHNLGQIIARDAVQFTSFRFTNSGTIRIGSSLALTNSYSYIQTASGKLIIEAAGTQPGVSHGQFRNRGGATLDGNLTLEVVGAFEPQAGQSFELLTYESRSGEFAVLNAPPANGAAWTSEYTPTSFRLRLAPSGGGPGSGGGGKDDPRGALHFDGGNAKVDVPHAESLNAFPLTIMAWVRTGRDALTIDGIVNKHTLSPLNGYSLYVFGGHLWAWYFRDEANYVWGAGASIDGGFIADGDWHQVAFVVDSSSGKLLVDGVMKAERAWIGSSGAVSSTEPLRFGRYAQDSKALLGDLDEVILLNAALTVDEINRHRTRRVTSSDDGRLIGLWHFDEKSGATSLDATGHGHNAAILGAEWIDSTVPAPPPQP